MAWNETLAQGMRDDLAGMAAVEKRMFGGLAFLVGGHMVCGIHKGGAMFRVGKPNEAAALAVDGTSPLQMGGRRMAGMVDCTDAACADAARRAVLMTLALGFVQALPPK